MNALKHHSVFRPSSRPSSPAPPSRPDSGIGFERVARPLNKLSLSNFRRPTPASTPAPTLPTLVQDGSYLEQLSLKLSEAVSRALQQPTAPPTSSESMAGKRPLPAGRGQALGILISSEMNAAADNSQLRRAIIRTLHRPLSVLLTNLNAAIIPLLAAPGFHAVPTVSSPTLTPPQLHALSFAALAGELVGCLDSLGLGLDTDPSGLKVIRDGLLSNVTRVINPLVGGIRSELERLIESLEVPSSQSELPRVAGTGNKASYNIHPAIAALTAAMPVYARALAKYTQWSHKALASCIISCAWKGLVALSHRPYSPPPMPPSPGSSSFLKKRRGSPTSSPPVTPSPGRFTIKLPPSRPASPPVLNSAASTDARALFELLNLLPFPELTQSGGSLANEAVKEAMNDLNALPTLLESVESSSGKIERLEHSRLMRLTDELPSLISLPILLSAFTDGLTVSGLLGLAELEYRRGCLSGFVRAEECATLVGGRLLDALNERAHEHEGVQAIMRWLDDELDLSEM